jgi:hypothetical protein
VPVRRGRLGRGPGAPKKHHESTRQRQGGGGVVFGPISFRVVLFGTTHHTCTCHLPGSWKAPAPQWHQQPDGIAHFPAVAGGLLDAAMPLIRRGRSAAGRSGRGQDAAESNQDAAVLDKTHCSKARNLRELSAKPAEISRSALAAGSAFGS